MTFRVGRKGPNAEYARCPVCGLNFWHGIPRDANQRVVVGVDRRPAEVGALSPVASDRLAGET